MRTSVRVVDEGVLRELVEEGWTLRALAERFAVDRATVRRRLRALGLETPHMARRRALAAARAEGRIETLAHCSRHGVTQFRLRDDGASYRCLRCRSEDVSEARRRRKQQLVAEAGGRCAACGYDRHPAALQFHHLDRSTKRFAVSGAGIPRRLDAARAEAAKCVLLCANCHAEVEAGVRDSPNMSARAADYLAAGPDPG